MKKFFKDYCRLYKESGRFYKEHWLGIVILNLVSIVSIFIPAIIYKIKDKMNNRKEVEKMNNEKEEES